MRIAVFGGTFNPVHYGHLRVAEEAREALSLDKVVFMPANIPPHKAEEGLIDPMVRSGLLRLATGDNPGFEISDMEIRRGGRSFTIDTVRELKQDHSLEVSLIIGNDSFNDITTWCEYEELLTLSSFIVVPRPEYPLKKPGEVLPVELAKKFWYDPGAGAYMNSFGNSITYLDTTMMDISASEIRRRIREGLSVRYLLPDAVIEYMRKLGLYR